MRKLVNEICSTPEKEKKANEMKTKDGRYVDGVSGGLKPEDEV